MSNNACFQAHRYTSRLSMHQHIHHAQFVTTGDQTKEAKLIISVIKKYNQEHAKC